MIKIILKDRLNPYRAESVVFETISPVKASVFIRGMQRGLLYNHWEIKTKIGDYCHSPELFIKSSEALK